MFRARLAVLVLSAGLSGCVTYHSPCGGGDPFGFSGFGPIAGPPCGCNGGVPLAAGGGPILDGGAGVPQLIPPPNGSGLGVQPGYPQLQAPPGARLQPQPLAQPMPSPP